MYRQARDVAAAVGDPELPGEPLFMEELAGGYLVPSELYRTAARGPLGISPAADTSSGRSRTGWRSLRTAWCRGSATTSINNFAGRKAEFFFVTRGVPSSNQIKNRFIPIRAGLDEAASTMCEPSL